MSYKWGIKPLSDTSRFVEARLKQMSSIERGSSDKDGNYTPARFRGLAKDGDGAIRIALGNYTTRIFINRYGRVDLESFAGRKAALSPRSVIQGRLVNLQPQIGRDAIIEIQDIIGGNLGPLDPQK